MRQLRPSLRIQSALIATGSKGRLIAILLTGGEAHDCPVAARLVNRVEPAQRMLGDKAYDSNELRDELDQRGTKPVIPNRSNRKRPFSFSKHLYKLRWRIESAFSRLKARCNTL